MKESFSQSEANPEEEGSSGERQHRHQMGCTEVKTAKAALPAWEGQEEGWGDAMKVSAVALGLVLMAELALVDRAALAALVDQAKEDAIRAAAAEMAEAVGNWEGKAHPR